MTQPEPHELPDELQRILRKIERMDPFGDVFSEREVLALKLAIELSRPQPEETAH